MEQGWIYVLVNSSIPGMVKVGRTSRPPNERVAELSAATGVATPFVLAFEQEFADCVAAEQGVHGELDRRGLRVAPNREFFRGSPAEIVRVILQAAAEHGDGPAWRPAKSANDLLAEGDRHMYGAGDCLQDLGEAVHFYRLAATRGSLVAVERLGSLFGRLRSRSRADHRRALRYLKDGAKRGNYYCYAELARLFAEAGHAQNFLKAWDLFFARRAQFPLAEVEYGADRYMITLREYIGQCLDAGQAPQHLPELAAVSEALTQHLMQALDQVRDAPETRQRLAAILRWTYLNLLPSPQPPMPAAGRRKWFQFWTASASRAAA